MTAILYRSLRRALPLAVLLTSALAYSQQADTALQNSADQAIRFVIAREALDPSALVPQTSQPLPTNGLWSAARVRPDSCPATAQTCLRVLYRVPSTEVSCEWVVLLYPDGVTGAILEQNLDSIRYLLRTVPASEIKSLILTRAQPLPSRRATGTIQLRVYVGTNGEPNNARIESGPEELRGPALTAIHQWLFKPLMAGNRAIPFQFFVKFDFSPSGRVTSTP